MSKKLALVTDLPPYTGIGTYAESLARLLSQSDIEAEVLSLSYTPVDPKYGWKQPPGCRLAHSRIEVPSTIVHNWRSLKSYVARDSPVHFCGATYQLAHLYTRSVVTVHDYYPRALNLHRTLTPRHTLIELALFTFSNWTFSTLPRQIRRARAIVVPTAHVQRCLERRTGLPSVVVPHWSDPMRFHFRERGFARRALGLPADPLLVLSVTGGGPNKNLDLMSRIARGLDSRFLFVKIGAPLSPGTPSIHMERVSDDLYPLLFNACNVYLHTSTEEGFGRPLLESVSSGLPIVAPVTEVSKEVIGGVARLVSFEDPIEVWIEALRSAATETRNGEVPEKLRLRLPQLGREAALHGMEHVYASAFGW